MPDFVPPPSTPPRPGVQATQQAPADTYNPQVAASSAATTAPGGVRPRSRLSLMLEAFLRGFGNALGARIPDYEERDFEQRMAMQKMNFEQDQLNWEKQKESRKEALSNQVEVTPQLADTHPTLRPLIGQRIKTSDYIKQTSQEQNVETRKLALGYDKDNNPLPPTSLSIPNRMKVELAGVTTKLRQAQVDAANYKQDTPAGQAARIKLQAIQDQARAAVIRAGASAGMTQIAAEKYAQDYVMGFTDPDTGEQMGLNQARVKAAMNKIPPAVAKIFGTYQQSKSRLAVMENSMEQGVKGDQQAMLNVLANHLGMTMGLQPGARMNQALIHEAEQSAPLLGRIQARYDDRGYLTGVVLTPEQMKSMVELARERVQQDARAVSETQTYFGVHGRGPAGTTAPGTITPKIGDTKTFPNGRKGRWDGKGWVAQ